LAGVSYAPLSIFGLQRRRGTQGHFHPVSRVPVELEPGLTGLEIAGHTSAFAMRERKVCAAEHSALLDSVSPRFPEPITHSFRGWNRLLDFDRASGHPAALKAKHPAASAGARLHHR
jgi:hypothetical protein